METHSPILPIEVLEHIQSFMSPKDAARSAATSKRLLSSWKTSKKLEFDERTFQSSNRFWRYVKNTLKRYELMGLKVEAVTFRITSGFERFPLANQLIVRASRLFAKEMTIDLIVQGHSFTLPPELFTSEQLIKLTVVGGKLNVGSDLGVLNNSLRSLTVLPLLIEGNLDDFFNNYVLKCPSLEELVCSGDLLSCHEYLIGNGIHGLRSLTIEGIRHKGHMFFFELVRRFPCLECLSISHLYNCKGFRISSLSIKFLSLTTDDFHGLTAEFSLPSLKMFYYAGVAWSNIKIEQHSIQWESNLRVVCFGGNDYWFVSFQYLLRSFESSHIFLIVNAFVEDPAYFHSYQRQRRLRSRSVQVECLDFRSNVSIPLFMRGLLKVCWPINVSIDGVVYPTGLARR